MERTSFVVHANSKIEMIDITKIREQFPGLNRDFYGHKMVYLDNTATSQTPERVVESIRNMYFGKKANVHRGVSTISQEATAMQEATRSKIRNWINAETNEEIIFTRGTTEGINLVASSFGEHLKEGDEIILTEMEHHANIVPWQLLRQRKGIKIKVVPLNEDKSTLNLNALKELLSPRTKLVSFTHVSNVLGTINPAHEIVEIAHNHGVPVLIDGAQAAPHLKIDVKELDADFYVFSAHKMYGPCGVGVLYGKKKWLEEMPPYQGGGEMISSVTFAHTTWADLPFKFEAGTPDFVDIAAFATALEFIEEVGLDNIEAHEMMLMNLAQKEMQKIPGMRIFGLAKHKSAVISFLLGKAHHFDTGMLLDHLGIAVRTGHHCAQPLMHALGIEGTVRASFAVYNTEEEVDEFIKALHRVLPMLS